ncbi:MAG: response regulator [Bermanella sp.]
MTPVLRKILYAEDDPDIQELTLLALESLGGFTVTCCNSGEQVVRLAQEVRPDLVLMDVMMPTVDGPTALQFLRDTQGCETIPVIFMTAKVMENEVQLFKDMGALDVIRKPYDPMTLCSDISEIWQRWCSER